MRREMKTKMRNKTNKIRKFFASIGYASKTVFAASKKYFIIMLLLSFLSSLLPYLPLFLWRELINDLTFAMAGSSAQLTETIWRLAVCYAAVLIAGKLLDKASEFVSFQYNDAIEYYLDNVMIDTASAVDLAFFDSSDLKDKLDRSWMLIYMTKNMMKIIFNIFQEIIKLVVSFSLLLTLSGWLIPVVVILCIPSVISDKKVNDIDYRFEKEYENDRRKLSYYKDLFFEGARQEVRLYNLKDYFSALYGDLWKLYDKAIHAKDIRVCIINLFSLAILTVNEVIVYALSVSKLIAKEIGVGDIAYYVSLLTQFRAVFTQICFSINYFGKYSDEIADVRSFIEMKPMLEKSGVKVPSAHPKIEFKDVSFRYPNGDRDVLSHCSFTVEPSEKLGLVGLNGSGKSTVVKLLCRFYDPTDGQILLDGIDSREYDIVKLRKLFGVLFQDYVKYSFSLRENVALSDISRINDTEAIYEACVHSKADEYVQEWENGTDENLTRRFDANGKELSGGQWQRVSLARAFFRDAPVVLLDEPSAALDPVAEHEIFEDFARVSKDKTALLISHRLSSITLCDRILVLRDGHINENGSHAELLRRGGEYARLFELQASKYM